MSIKYRYKLQITIISLHVTVFWNRHFSATAIKLGIFFTTRTLVQAESGKSIATAGTEVPVPKKLDAFLEPGLQSGLRMARK